VTNETGAGVAGEHGPERQDPDELREETRRRWAGIAAGWARQQGVMRVATAPVSHWLVEAIRPQPGHRVLELAAGQGETGFLAAELIKPGGVLVSSDASQEMLEGARARAAELELGNVDFQVIDAEWIDLPVASVDGVLCRWGYMLMADPDAALRETRRVLRPGGRVALAAWAGPDANPWASVPARELVRRGHVPAPEPGAPGMFAFADGDAVAARLEEAGFSEVEVEPLEFQFAFPSLEAWWETQLDLSPILRPTLDGLGPAEAAATRSAIEEQLARYVTPASEAVMPACTLVAAASA
jgi:SAM-dependent methyltransferase